MTRWTVGLSNGENHSEGVVPFYPNPGQKSPWLRLIDYLNTENLTITSLAIVSGDRTFNLPSAGNNPKFRAFYDIKKPISFNFFRMIGSEGGKLTDRFSVAEAVYPNCKLQLWVDENNPNNCWVLVVPKNIIKKGNK